MINFPGNNRKLKNERNDYLVGRAIDILSASQNYYLKGKINEDYLMDDIDNVLNILEIVQEKLKEGKH